MPRLSRLARLAALLALLGVVLVGTSACGCCDDDGDDYYGGTLQVVNDPQSDFGIETVGVSVPGGPVELFDVFLAPGEDAFIDVYPDDYDVDLWWSDLYQETIFGVSIWDDEVTQLIGFRVL
jgi:hypothetical protein